jgi:two-component system nitrogen regulation sensor histidine kinase NtrY
MTVAPSTDAFRDLLDGEDLTAVEPIGEAELVRGGAPIEANGQVTGAVVADAYVPVSLSQRAADIERSFREYKELKILKQPIKNTYLLTLTLITLVVVFAATWYGLSLAKGITVPIQQLAEGTREATGT